MSKKKDKGHNKTSKNSIKALPGQGGNNRGKLIQFRDMTAERQYQLQLSQARQFYDQEEYEDAMDLLESLRPRFGERLPLLELLGVAYAKIGLTEAARDTLYDALLVATPKTTIPGKALPQQPLRFNLAQFFLTTGFAFLAYELSLGIDFPALYRESNGEVSFSKAKEFIAICRNAVEAISKDRDETDSTSFEDYLPFAIEMDRGRYALARHPQNAIVALSAFEKACQLNPLSPAAFNNLGLALILSQQFEEALAQFRHVIAELDPQNLHALSNTVKLLASLDRIEEAASYVTRLKELTPREQDGPTAPIKLAEAFAALEDDQAVFEILNEYLGDPIAEEDALKELSLNSQAILGQTLIANPVQSELIPDQLTATTAPRPRDLLKRFDRTGYLQVLALLIVASANLGRVERALNLQEEFEKVAKELEQSLDTLELVERTSEALLDHEYGPRAGGRYFYFSSRNSHSLAMHYYEELVGQALTQTHSDLSNPTVYAELFHNFFERYEEVAQDCVAYAWWITALPGWLEMQMGHALASGHPLGLALVKRFAFGSAEKPGRVGNTMQRISAARSLLKAGFLSPEEPLTIWIGLIPRTGTLSQLEANYHQAIARYEEEWRKIGEEFRQQQEQDDPEYEKLVDEMVEARKKDDPAQQVAAYRRLLELKPDDNEVLYSLGTSLLWQYQHLTSQTEVNEDSRVEDQITLKESEIAKTENRAASRYLEEAEHIFQQVLAIDPHHSGAKLRMVEIYQSRGELDRALEKLAQSWAEITGFDQEEVVDYYSTAVELLELRRDWQGALMAARPLVELTEFEDRRQLYATRVVELEQKLNFTK